MLNVLESSPIAQLAIGLDHKVTYWNRACELLTGLSAEEMIGGESNTLGPTMVSFSPPGGLEDLSWVDSRKCLMLQPTVSAPLF